MYTHTHIHTLTYTCTSTHTCTNTHTRKHLPHALAHSAVKNWWNKITASLSDQLLIFFSLAYAVPDQLNTGNYQLTYTLNVINPQHLIISSQLRTNTLSHKTPRKICTSFWQGRPFLKCNQQAVWHENRNSRHAKRDPSLLHATYPGAEQSDPPAPSSWLCQPWWSCPSASCPRR